MIVSIQTVTTKTATIELTHGELGLLSHLAENREQVIKAMSCCRDNPQMRDFLDNLARFLTDATKPERHMGDLA